MLNTRIATGLIFVSSTLTGCASFDQTSDDVYRRESGSTLKPWKSALEGAKTHLPFAWAAVSAYLHEADGKNIEVSETCPEPHAYLSSKNWQLWTDLPRVGRKSSVTNDLEKKLQDAHLRVEVWSNEVSNTVIVAFGGTASLDDVGANARWFLPFGEPDAYHALTDEFVPAFSKAYRARLDQPEWAWLQKARVISTGHSLGGGLAQRFAYSLKPANKVPGVNEVYAFNPSPVSGKRSVLNYKERAEGLTIYRIYNRGEILAGVRSILQWGNPGNERNQGQTFVEIRYSSDWSWRSTSPAGWIKAHGMHQLACFMKLHTEKASETSSLSAR